MPTVLRSRHSTVLFAVGCGQCYADKSTDLDNANAITNNGRMLSSLISGFSLCLKPTDSRANPDEETTDWRARRGKTAHRVRREGTASAVPYPYPSTLSSLSPVAGLGHSGSPFSSCADTAVARSERRRIEIDRANDHGASDAARETLVRCARGPAAHLGVDAGTDRHSRLARCAIARLATQPIEQWPRPGPDHDPLAAGRSACHPAAGG